MTTQTYKIDAIWGKMCWNCNNNAQKYNSLKSFETAEGKCYVNVIYRFYLVIYKCGHIHIQQCHTMGSIEKLYTADLVHKWYEQSDLNMIFI